MKHSLLYRLPLLALLLSLGFACKKSDATDGPVNVGGYLESGNWHVSSFMDSGQDETAHFSGYTFTFAANGAVVATNTVTTATGYWGSGIDDGVSKVHLFFQTPPDFQDLNDDWDVRNASVTRIELADTSGGGSGVDVLVLERD
ncbi:MAG: hypothetical protein EOO16_16875 [Chitinophagaceae bacterium]|nr:MAG: hypothetical protein EOO16_16875 [Chitinophagaceae bacterium]